MVKARGGMGACQTWKPGARIVKNFTYSGAVSKHLGQMYLKYN